MCQLVLCGRRMFLRACRVAYRAMHNRAGGMLPRTALQLPPAP